MNTVNKSSAGRAKAIPAAEFIIASVILLLLEAFLFFNFFINPGITAAATVRAELAARGRALDDYINEKAGEEDRYLQLYSLLDQIEIAEEKLPPALHNEDIAIMIGLFSRANNITIESVSFSERQLADPSDYISIAGATVTPLGNNVTYFNDNAAPAGAVETAGEDAALYIDGAAPFGGAAAPAGEDTDMGLYASNIARQSALFDDNILSNSTLSLQNVQINFSSEFHTIGPFVRSFEESGRKVRIKGVSITRIQEGELKGVLNLEFASLSASAEQNRGGLYSSLAQGEADAGRDVDIGAGAKESLFSKYSGFIEDNADPTILLLSEDDDIDPDFYIVLKASTSNETKISYGVYPRVETELRSNVNNATRAKLTINGDEDQFEYVYSLASYQKSEKRKLTASGGVIRVKVLSCQRIGDNDNVAILLDIDNNTELPVEIIVVNDDVLSPRFYMGLTKGNVNVVTK